ncbi:MAG: MBL fold metallo-hydrolase [Pseudomonadales bacterium]|jgi:glyoxylase-like metal-dependent hydrolase (beta-lactamase superfamily II)|nr:MBL fold metallo-hydrolase [Pseudomonadales bacterium]
MNVWQIGSVKITRIVELEAVGGSRFILPDATPEACREIAWLAPHFMDADGRLRMSVHALVVDTGERRILVDTCIGNDKERSVPAWSNLQTRFLEDLEAAGYPPSSIDTVLCTHLHVDHVGWNTRLVEGRWVPTFPRARYLFSEREWAYWSEAEDDEYGPVIDDSVRPVIDADLAELVADDAVLCDEVRLQPTPGHTPGHVSVVIESQDQRALITGDFVHHPCQLARPDWGSSADWDPAAARSTRETTLAALADAPVLVIGTHFATPTAGRVRRDGEVFRFEV